MAKRKQKTVYLTPEPKWEMFKDITDATEQEKAFQDCQYFIRTEIGDKKRMQRAKTWIKKDSPWNDEDREIILRNPDWNFNSLANSVWFSDKVGYMPQAHIDHIVKVKEEWMEKGEKIAKVKEEKEKDKPKRPSIQDIMKEKLLEAGGEIDGLVDQWMEDEIKNDDKFTKQVMSICNNYNPLANHIPLLVALYEKEQKEFKEVIEGKDEQLVEAYSHFSKKKLKATIALYDTVTGVLNSYASLKIASRAKRKTKPITPEKATQKLKYQKRFECNATKLKLESIRPAELHLSKEAWVYDTTKRKLHHYIADEMTGEMFVKGNTLLGFDKSKSQIKTLRKPLEQIKEVMGSKPAARTYFDKIKAVGIKPTGRFNDSLIILKAF
tara:strand:+ start:1506 stop:2648 length:1143 start_codon:yes stop_codon:yes gene_type:complete